MATAHASPFSEVQNYSVTPEMVRDTAIFPGLRTPSRAHDCIAFTTNLLYAPLFCAAQASAARPCGRDLHPHSVSLACGLGWNAHKRCTERALACRR